METGLKRIGRAIQPGRAIPRPAALHNDHKWASRGNTIFRARAVFRSMKSLLDTRPIFHKCDETIRGHVSCSFLALLLRKQLEDRLARKQWKLEWADVIRDLDNLVEMEVRSAAKATFSAARRPE